MYIHKFLWGVVTLLIFAFNSAVAHSQSPKPNIIFIIADDVSWDDIGCYGNEVVKTPHIDKLASNGIRFTNTYLTASSCSPSRNSIITGRYPHNTGAPELHMELPEAQVPFPLLMKENGYYTMQAGKFHFGPSALGAFDDAYQMQDAGTGGEERWVKSLQDRPKDKPFFAWFASIDAHRVWQADNFHITHDPENIEVPPYLVDAPATRQDLASYYNEIARLDYYVGEVVKELEQQGILDNTLIMFVSDNGRPFPGCKTRVYDRGMKTPMVMQWPGQIEKGITSNSLVSVIDIAPTFLEIAGIDPTPEFLGKSFTSLFDNPEAEFRQYVFAEHNWHDYEAYERMIRTKNFLYLVNERPLADQRGPADSNNGASFQDLKKQRDQGLLTAAQTDIFMAPRPRYELYDCINDTKQLVNVASLEKYQVVVRDLSAVLEQWQEETKDNVPENLSKDRFEKETGQQIEGIEWERGETPGVKSGALGVKKDELTIF